MLDTNPVCPYEHMLDQQQTLSYLESSMGFLVPGAWAWETEEVLNWLVQQQKLQWLAQVAAQQPCQQAQQTAIETSQGSRERSTSQGC